METILVPDAAVPYILFQRTLFLALPKMRGYWRIGWLNPHKVLKLAIALESRFRKKQVKTLFQNEMLKEYQALQKYLPENCNAILDIGCGVAGIDILLFRRYGNAQIFLLDKTQLDEKAYHGFSHRAAFYNSLQVARDLLLANGTSASQIHLIEATPNNDIPISVPLDLVISTFSWGYHYPVSAYLDRVYDLLSEQGRLILDVRKRTNGRESLEQKFGKVQVIEENDNNERILARKQI